MRIDMSGKKYGHLTVLKKAGVYRNSDTTWLCRCDCGELTIVRGSFLRNGHTKTCGKGCMKFQTVEEGILCTVKTGRSFLIDKEDLTFVQKYRWSVSSDGYVLGVDAKGKKVKLHRLLAHAKEYEVVDHINGNPSDCRRSNLRVTTQYHNTFNSRLPISSTTGYKGVCWDKRRKRYMAHIHPNGKMIFLGYYDDIKEAAIAYDNAALLYFGEYARLNFGRKEETGT